MGKEVLYGKNAVLEALRAGRNVHHLLVSSDTLKKEPSMTRRLGSKRHSN